MIDLHLHLDGSLEAKTVLFLAREQSIPLPAETETELKEHLTAPQNCRNLIEYLTHFELPLLVLQTREALSYAVYDLVKRLDAMGLWYAEIRFAPQLHTVQGLTQKEAVGAALDGLTKALGECNINSQLILCCMRGADKEEKNRETIRLTREFLHSGVAAADLAGAEGLYRTALFENVFRFAKQLEIPFTIHAGEADGAGSIADAVQFGASRIGHGLRAREDAALIALLAARRIPLELCPTSNLQTKAVERISDYPVRVYLERGIVATVNTDNMTVSDTDIHKEFDLLKRELRLTREEEKQLVIHSVLAAFIEDDEKQRLLSLVEKRYGAAK